MLHVLSPIGTKLLLPETLEEDVLYFTLNRLAKALLFYETHGFVVIRGLIPTDMCAHVRARFRTDVRLSRVPILRQKNMCYERNAFDADGFLSNPIFNVQDLGSGSLSRFRDDVLDILTYPAAVAAELLGGGRAKLIQSMYFEAPAGTWAHQDSYYQDSATRLGGAIAAWFALEDIDAKAGRFYVCPGSHKMTPIRNQGTVNVGDGHAAYQQARVIRF